jgi:hypothetical protein
MPVPKGDEKQKLLDVLNGITLASNAFLLLDREKYPNITPEVWERLAIDIRELSAKFELVSLLQH